MHSDRYASYEFQQGLHAKEFLSGSLFLRYNLGLYLSEEITVHSVRASFLLHFYALLELGPGFLSAVGVSVCVCVWVALLMPCFTSYIYGAQIYRILKGKELDRNIKTCTRNCLLLNKFLTLINVLRSSNLVVNAPCSTPPAVSGH